MFAQVSPPKLTTLKEALMISPSDKGGSDPAQQDPPGSTSPPSSTVDFGLARQAASTREGHFRPHSVILHPPAWL